MALVNGPRRKHDDIHSQIGTVSVLVTADACSWDWQGGLSAELSKHPVLTCMERDGPRTIVMGSFERLVSWSEEDSRIQHIVFENHAATNSRCKYEDRISSTLLNGFRFTGYQIFTPRG